MKELRFLGIHVWMQGGKRSATFIRCHLPTDRREDFKQWCAVRNQRTTFTCSEGARVYDIVRRGKGLEVTMRQVGALSMSEVKELQTSWNPGTDLPVSFMAIEAVDRPDVDKKVRENVANSLPWDEDVK